MTAAVDGDALAHFALRLVGRRSPSGEEGDVAELVTAEMGRLGYAVDVDALGNVVGTLDLGEGPCVLFDSHMDTVGVTDPDAWSRSPEGEVVEGRLYGRGAMDMKGPLAACVHGVAAAAEQLPSGRVVVTATVAEELVEGPALVAVAESVRPDLVVICEATGLGLAVGQRGRAEIVVEVEGRPTHSSRPELGVNAAEAMADVITALRRVQPPSHPQLGRGVLVITDVISRPYPGLSVVPDRCLATYDRRTLPGETEESVLAPVREAVAAALGGGEAGGRVFLAEDDFATYTGARVRAVNFAPAWYLEPDSPPVRLVAAALERAGLAVGITHYAFCTNGSGTAGRLGIPTVGFGPGDEEMAHRVDEHVELDQLATAARGYGGIAERALRAGR